MALRTTTASAALAAALAAAPSAGSAADLCSRVALIDFQEVLVDTDNNQRGEGLRRFLERDPTALAHLERYQEGARLTWRDTVAGSVGTGLILGGLLAEDGDRRRGLLAGGGVFMLVNFLVARTVEHANEGNLERAIEEYNKRNAPAIRLRRDGTGSPSLANPVSFAVKRTWSF